MENVEYAPLATVLTDDYLMFIGLLTYGESASKPLYFVRMYVHTYITMCFTMCFTVTNSC